MAGPEGDHQQLPRRRAGRLQAAGGGEGGGGSLTCCCPGCRPGWPPARLRRTWQALGWGKGKGKGGGVPEGPAAGACAGPAGLVASRGASTSVSGAAPGQFPPCQQAGRRLALGGELGAGAAGLAAQVLDQGVEESQKCWGRPKHCRRHSPAVDDRGAACDRRMSALPGARAALSQPLGAFSAAAAA